MQNRQGCQTHFAHAVFFKNYLTGPKILYCMGQFNFLLKLGQEPELSTTFNITVSSRNVGL